MTGLFFLIAQCVVAFIIHLIGRIIATPDNAFFSKFFKKHHPEGYSVNVTKNFFGNIFAVSGAFFVFLYYFGTNSIYTYAIAGFLIFWALLRHFSDISMQDIRIVFYKITLGNFSATNVFFKISCCLIIAFAITGAICCNYIYPKVASTIKTDEPAQTEQIEESQEKNYLKSDEEILHEIFHEYGY